MFVLIGIIASCAIIWFSSESISKISDVIGRGWNHGVRGATINAVSSSLPELFTASFFLLALNQVSGFVSGIATMAGSAIYNALVIPGLMGFVSIWKLKQKLPEHNHFIVRRDGLWLLGTQVVVLFIIRSGSIGWWKAAGLLGIYLAYIIMLNRHRKDGRPGPRPVPRKTKMKAFRNLAFQVVIMGAACYILVESCVQLGEQLGFGMAILGLLVAATATSLPDTFLSVRDAWRGQPDDGISNALGSNIFDLCVALGLPVLVYSLTVSEIRLDAGTIEMLSNIWYVLMGLTIVALVAMLSGKRLHSRQVAALAIGYAIFLGLVVTGTLQVNS